MNMDEWNKQCDLFQRGQITWGEFRRSIEVTEPAQLDKLLTQVLNSRVKVEQELFDMAAGKKPMPDAAKLRELAVKLGDPTKREVEPAQQGAKGEACPICHGTGKHWMAIARLPGQPEFSETLVDCNHCKTKAAPQAAPEQQAERVKLFKTTVLGVGPYCIEFPDGEIIHTRSEDRQLAIAAALAPQPSERPAPAGQAVLMALAHIRWASFGECRTPGWEAAPPTATETVAVLEAVLVGLNH